MISPLPSGLLSASKRLQPVTLTRAHVLCKPFAVLVNSALLMAAQHAHGALSMELVESGARPDAATLRGFTPLMLACLYDQQELLIDLLDRGTATNEKRSQIFIKGAVQVLRRSAALNECHIAEHRSVPFQRASRSS